MQYKNRHGGTPIQAFKLVAPTVLTSGTTVFTGKAGDYLCIYDNGEMAIYAPGVIQANYEPDMTIPVTVTVDGANTLFAARDAAKELAGYLAAINKR